MTHANQTTLRGTVAEAVRRREVITEDDAQLLLDCADVLRDTLPPLSNGQPYSAETRLRELCRRLTAMAISDAVASRETGESERQALLRRLHRLQEDAARPRGTYRP